MALSGNRTDIGLNSTGLITLKLTANHTFYQGAMCMINDAGEARKADDVASMIFAGIAMHYAKSGASDDVYLQVQTEGSFIAKASSAVAGWVGEVCYVSDDETVTITAPTNKVSPGIIVEVISGTQVRVLMVKQLSAAP